MAAQGLASHRPALLLPLPLTFLRPEGIWIGNLPKPLVETTELLSLRDFQQPAPKS
jgi:hypothetical protein